MPEIESESLRSHPLIMKIGVLTAVFLAVYLPAFAQPAVSRTSLQQFLGFED